MYSAETTASGTAAVVKISFVYKEDDVFAYALQENELDVIHMPYLCFAQP